MPTNIVDTHTDIDGDGDVDDVDIFWNPKNDPANWQHMVNYTIGLGVFGTHDFPDDYEALLKRGPELARQQRYTQRRREDRRPLACRNQ